MDKKLLEHISAANKILIFSGAGVSTPSGIKDFRGQSGLYEEKFLNLNPERILSASFF